VQGLINRAMGSAAGAQYAMDGYAGLPTAAQLRQLDWAWEDANSAVATLNQLIQQAGAYRTPTTPIPESSPSRHCAHRARRRRTKRHLGRRKSRRQETRNLLCFSYLRFLDDASCVAADYSAGLLAARAFPSPADSPGRSRPYPWLTQTNVCPNESSDAA